MATGVVAGELYSNPAGADKTTIVEAPPPSAPSPIPAVVAKPAVVKPRMADENPDGSMRDTSTEAMRPGNDLGFRNLDDEPKEPSQPPQVEAQKEQAPVQEPIQEPTLYAGKFKTPQDLEKAYQEAEKRMNSAMQEAAELRKKGATPAAPATPAPTPEQVAQTKQKLLEAFVNDPQSVLKEYTDRAQQNTMLALDAQKRTEEWRKANPDLAAHERFVAAEAYFLTQSDPEISKEPARLLQQATENFRKVFGAIRSEGAKEALATETRVTPLLSSTAPATASEQPAKAPLTFDDAFAQHMKMLKAEESKSHRGLRP